MIDLRHGLAQRRQPGTRTQGVAHLFLHGDQLIFDMADLVGPARQSRRGADVFGIGAEALDGVGQARNGTHHPEGQAGEDQDTGRQRNTERDAQHAAEAGAQVVTQRLGRHDDFDQVVVADARFGFEMHQAIGIAEQGFPWRPQIDQVATDIAMRAAQVDHLVRHDRIAVPQTIGPDAVVKNSQIGDAGALAQLVRRALRHLFRLRGIDGLGGDFGAHDTVGQPAFLIRRQARHKDDDLDDGDEDGRGDQQLAGQAEGKAAQSVEGFDGQSRGDGCQGAGGMGKAARIGGYARARGRAARRLASTVRRRELAGIAVAGFTRIEHRSPFGRLAWRANADLYYIAEMRHKKRKSD